MTNELAIRILTGDVLGTSEQTQEAVTMAIKALSQPDVPDTNVGDSISRQAAIEKAIEGSNAEGAYGYMDTKSIVDMLEDLPSTEPVGYIKIPETGIDDLSDGFHTFRQLYYQRMMLFATIVKQNRDNAWKSLRHENGELCFGGGWFIVGIDTPEGSYTYHYEDNFYGLFECKELDFGKHWDGHTEKDVTRLLSLPSAQSERKRGKWIPGKEIASGYIAGGTWTVDYESYKCSSCGLIINDLLYHVDGSPFYKFCPNCGAEMEGEAYANE